MTGMSLSKFGKIVDLSLNGIAFDYLVNTNDADTSTKESNIVKFFSMNADFHLHELHCKVIYDIPISTTKHSDDGIILKNRCGVQFLSLTDSQTEQLNQFVQTYTDEHPT